MYVVYNKVIFDNYGFKDKKFNYMSFLEFIPIGSNSNLVQRYTVQTS